MTARQLGFSETEARNGSLQVCLMIFFHKADHSHIYIEKTKTVKIRLLPINMEIPSKVTSYGTLHTVAYLQ